MRITGNFLRNLTLVAFLVIFVIGVSANNDNNNNGSVPSITTENFRTKRQVLLNPEYSYELVEETVEDDEPSPPPQQQQQQQQQRRQPPEQVEMEDDGQEEEDEEEQEEEEEIEVEVDDEEFEKYARYASTHPENFRFASNPIMISSPHPHLGRQIKYESHDHKSNNFSNNRQGHRYPSNQEVTLNNQQQIHPNHFSSGKQQNGQKSVSISKSPGPALSIVPGGFLQQIPHKRMKQQPGKNFNGANYDYFEQQQQEQGSQFHPKNSNMAAAADAESKQRTINRLNEKIEPHHPPTKKQQEPMKLTRASIRAREHLKFTVTPRSTTTTTLKTTEPFSTVKPTAVQITHVIPRVRVQTAQPPIIIVPPRATKKAAHHRKNGDQNKKIHHGSAETKAKNFGTGTTHPFRPTEKQNYMTPTKPSFTSITSDKRTPEVMMTTPSFLQLDKNLLKRQFQVSPSSPHPPKMASPPSPSTPPAVQFHVTRPRGGSVEKFGHSSPIPITIRDEIGRVTMANFGPSPMPPGWNQISQNSHKFGPSLAPPLQNVQPLNINIARPGSPSSSELRSKNRSTKPASSSSEKKSTKSSFEQITTKSSTVGPPIIEKVAAAPRPPPPPAMEFTVTGPPPPSQQMIGFPGDKMIQAMSPFTVEEEKKIEELRRQFEREEALAREKMRVTSLERGNGPFDQFKSIPPPSLAHGHNQMAVGRSREIIQGGSSGSAEKRIKGGSRSNEENRKVHPASKGKKKGHYQSSKSEETNHHQKGGDTVGQLIFNHQKIQDMPPPVRSSHETLRMIRPLGNSPAESAHFSMGQERSTEENIERLKMTPLVLSNQEQMMEANGHRQNGPSSTERLRNAKLKPEKTLQIHRDPVLQQQSLTPDLSKETWQGPPPPKMQGGVVVGGEQEFGQFKMTSGSPFELKPMVQIQYTTSPSFISFTENQKLLIGPSQSPFNVDMMGSEFLHPASIISNQRSQHGHQEQRQNNLFHSSIGPLDNFQSTFETPHERPPTPQPSKMPIVNDEKFFSVSPTPPAHGHVQQQQVTQSRLATAHESSISRPSFGSNERKNSDQMEQQQFRSTERSIGMDRFGMIEQNSPSMSPFVFEGPQPTEAFSHFLSKIPQNLMTVDPPPPPPHHSQQDGRMPLLQNGHGETDLHASSSIESLQFTPALSIRHHSLEGVMTAKQPQPNPHGASEEEKRQHKFLMDRQAEFESKFEMENLRIRELQQKQQQQKTLAEAHQIFVQNLQQQSPHQNVNGPTQQPWRDEQSASPSSNGKTHSENLSMNSPPFESTRQPMQVRMPLVNENMERNVGDNGQWMMPQSPPQPKEQSRPIEMTQFMTTMRPSHIQNGPSISVHSSKGTMGQEMRPEFSQLEPEEVMPALPPPHGKKQLESRQDIFEAEQQQQQKIDSIQNQDTQFTSFPPIKQNDTKLTPSSHPQMIQTSFQQDPGPSGHIQPVQPIDDHHEENLRAWSSTLHSDSGTNGPIQFQPMEERAAVTQHQNEHFIQQNLSQLFPFENIEENGQKKMATFGQQLVGASMGPSSNEFLEMSQQQQNDPSNFEPNPPQFQVNGGQQEVAAIVQPDFESSEEILQSMQRRPSPVEIAEKMKMLQTRQGGQKNGPELEALRPTEETLTNSQRVVQNFEQDPAAAAEQGTADFSNIDDYSPYGLFNGPPPPELARMSYPAVDTSPFNQNMAAGPPSQPDPVPSFMTPEEMIHSFPLHQTADQPGHSWNPSEPEINDDKSQLYGPSFGSDDDLRPPSGYENEEKVPQPQSPYEPMYEQPVENVDFSSQFGPQTMDVSQTFNSRQKIMDPTPQLLATQKRMQAFNQGSSSPQGIPSAKSVQAGPIIELFEMGRDMDDFPYPQSLPAGTQMNSQGHDQLDPSVPLPPPQKSPAIQKQQRRRRVKGPGPVVAAAEGRRRRRPKNKETVRPIIIRKKDPSESSRLKLGSRITRKIAESRLANRQKGATTRSKSSSLRPREEKDKERTMESMEPDSSKNIANLAPSQRKDTTTGSRVKGPRKPAQKFKKGLSTPQPTQPTVKVTDKPSRRRKGSGKISSSKNSKSTDEERPVSSKKIKSAPKEDESKNSRRSSTKSSGSRYTKKSEKERPAPSSSSSSSRKLSRTSTKIKLSSISSSAVAPIEISSTSTSTTATPVPKISTTHTIMTTLSRRRLQLDPIPIWLEISIENLALNEENMELSLDFYLKQSWTNPILKLENLDFQFNETFENSKAWDLMKSNGDLMNEVHKEDEKSCRPHKILTNSKGLNSVTMDPSYKISQISMTISCPMTYHSFPMDSQIFHIDLHHFNLHGDDETKYEFQWKSFRFISQNGDHHGDDEEMDSKFSKLYPLQVTGYRLKNETTTTMNDQNHGRWKKKFENENVQEFASSFEILLKRPLKSFYQLRIFLPPSLMVTLGLATLFFGNHGVPRLAVTVAGILGFVLIAIWGGGGGLNLPADAHSTIKMGDIFTAACFVTILLCFIVSLVLYWLERKRRKLKKFNEMYKINKLAADKIQSRQRRDNNVLGKILVDAENGFQKKQTKCEGWMRRVDLSTKILLPMAFLVFNISYWIYCLEFMTTGVEKKNNLYW